MTFIKPRLAPELFKRNGFSHQNKLINLKMVKCIGLSRELSSMREMFYSITFDNEKWMYDEESVRDREYEIIKAMVAGK